MHPAASQILRKQRRKLAAKICIEMEDNPARENRKNIVEKQAGESKAPKWRLCSPHRPAEPGGRARNYGPLQDSQGGVREGHTRGC